MKNIQMICAQLPGEREARFYFLKAIRHGDTHTQDMFAPQSSLFHAPTMVQAHTDKNGRTVVAHVANHVHKLELDVGRKRPYTPSQDKPTKEVDKMKDGKITYTFPVDSPVPQLRGVTAKNGAFKASSGKYSDPIDMVQFDLVLKIDGKDRRIGAMIKGKPELEKLLADHNASIAAEKSALESIGWTQYEKVQSKAINARCAYDAASKYGYPMKQAAAMREADEALEAARIKYPFAAAYALAESYSFARNDMKSSAGSRAMAAIKGGADPLKAIEKMESDWSAAASKAVENS